jgi:hypothetical protein
MRKIIPYVLGGLILLLIGILIGQTDSSLDIESWFAESEKPKVEEESKPRSTTKYYTEEESKARSLTDNSFVDSTKIERIAKKLGEILNPEVALPSEDGFINTNRQEIGTTQYLFFDKNGHYIDTFILGSKNRVRLTIINREPVQNGMFEALEFTVQSPSGQKRKLGRGPMRVNGVLQDYVYLSLMDGTTVMNFEKIL